MSYRIDSMAHHSACYRCFAFIEARAVLGAFARIDTRESTPGKNCKESLGNLLGYIA